MSAIWKALTKRNNCDGGNLNKSEKEIVAAKKKTVKQGRSNSSSRKSKTTSSSTRSETEKTEEIEETNNNNNNNNHKNSNFRTPNEQTIDEYLTAVDRRESVEQLLQYFTSGNVPVLMEDNPPTTACFLLHEIRKVYISFPDVQFRNESIKEVRPGEVLLEEMEVTGTHTGPAYQFAVFPPVPTTNKHVVLDRERLWFTLKDGKIDKMEVIALGNLTGPPGMYMSVGGKIEMPPPPEGTEGGPP